MGLAFVIGPILAGVVAAKVGSVWAIGIDALTFGASAFTLAGIRFRREGKAVTKAGKSGVFDGVKFLREEPQLRAITIIFILLAILSSGTIASGILDVIIFHLKNVLGANDRVVGLALGVGAVGAVVGALMASSLRRRFGFKRCFVGATMTQGISILAMGIGGQVLVLGVGAAAWTAGMTLRGVVTQTLRQELTPELLLGRVTAAFWTLAAVLAPLGAALITGVAARWGTNVAFEAAGIGVILVSLGSAVLLRPSSVLAPLVPDDASRPTV
jgi:MFS family permease